MKELEKIRNIICLALVEVYQKDTYLIFKNSDASDNYVSEIDSIEAVQI